MAAAVVKEMVIVMIVMIVMIVIMVVAVVVVAEVSGRVFVIGERSKKY